MNLSDFDYELPPELISQAPAEPRETARLMVLSRAAGTLVHRHVGDLPDLLQPGDLVVVNSSKVFRARLTGVIAGTDDSVEVFLVRPRENGWLVLVKPGKKCPPGTRIRFNEDFAGVVSARHADGSATMDFGLQPAAVIAQADRYGSIPIPPYIKRAPRPEEYQTVYAKQVGSVAAPTAGFHLSQAVLHRFAQKHITVAELTLHVGLGTFQPIRTENIADHAMHAEWVELSEASASLITAARQQGRRVIAIGTTTVRALEGIAAAHDGNLTAYTGDVNLFITPGFSFRVVDVLMTNFHLPKSSLIVLVSAFAGREFILRAYREAVRERYRFYSFGDAMLIL